MPEQREILIVGGGPAAKSAAAAYREAGGGGPLRILSADLELPYERPPLTKDYLRGETSREDLFLEKAGWYEERGISVERGVEVAALDLESGEARSADGRAWSFDRCLLATGARPLVPGIPGAGAPGVRTVRTIADSEKLRTLAGGSVVVVGSGFIGCEVAASLLALGARVTLATLETAPQVERLGDEVAARLESWLLEAGARIEGEAELAEISSAPGATRVRFEDGREVDAGGAVLALGIVRNDELARQAGVEVDDGVLVDAAMVSSDPRLLACGDVAAAENPRAGRRLRLEHWGEALNMGKVAGEALAGRESRWDVAPGFWSTIGERTLKYVGWGDGWDRLEFTPGSGQSFVCRYGREGVLVGVLTLGDDEVYEAGREEVEGHVPWS